MQNAFTRWQTVFFAMPNDPDCTSVYDAAHFLLTLLQRGPLHVLHCGVLSAQRFAYRELTFPAPVHSDACSRLHR